MKAGKYIVSILFAAAALATPASVIADNDIRAASTVPEVALVKILKIADSDEQILDNLFDRYPNQPVPASKRVDYQHLFTHAFFNSLRQKQRKMVQQDCGGKYLDGEICGMDFNPITCAQDNIVDFRHRPVRINDDKAIIRDKRDDTYTLVRENGVWKLDGVECSGK